MSRRGPHTESHQRALLMPAHYIQATPGERDPRAFTPDESRRARALPMYAALRVLGRDGVGEIVDRCCALAVRMAARLASDERARILNDVVLNQVLVQFRPPDGDDAAAEALTEKVIARVQEEGTCWAGGTKWHGQAAMRVSMSNWSTTADDIDRSAAAMPYLIERYRVKSVDDAWQICTRELPLRDMVIDFGQAGRDK